MKRITTLSISVFLCLLFTSSLRAQDLKFEDSVFPELVTSARALGMGNAFIAKVDDSSASFYNPAGLGTVRKWHFHLSNFQFDFNKGFANAGLGGMATDVPGNVMSAFSADGLREILLDKKGKMTFNRFQLMPNFTMRFFSLGYMYSKKSKALVTTDETSPEFQYAYRRDHGPYASLNISFWGGILKLGMTGVMLNRKEINLTQAASAAVELEDGDYKKGATFYSISGAKLTLPFKLLPTFSVTSHNTFEGDFSSRAAGKPDQIEKTLDVGFSVTPMLANTVRLHLEANFKDVEGNVKGVSEKRRMLLGMELDIYRALFFRLGYGDGFGSAGVGIRSKSFEFDLSSYAVDTSDKDFRGDEDRRFALSLSSGF